MAGGHLDFPEHFAAGLTAHSVSERYYYARGPQLVNRVVDISQTIDKKLAAIQANKTMIGNMLRQVLTGRLVVPGVSGGRALSSAAMALLFAADRMDHLDAEILPNLIDGVTVLSDRYDFSSVAYQAASDEHSDSAVSWIRTLNERARRPDLTIVLDVSSGTAASRRRERSGRPEIYDDVEFQSRLAGFYRELDRKSVV